MSDKAGILSLVDHRMTAIFSPCELYRYRLGRVWDIRKPRCVFIMLNPSTADHRLDDPTIRRCINFAKREDCGQLEVVNLFAYRSPNPDVLRVVEDPVGPDNDKYIEEAVNGAVLTIVAWGIYGIMLLRDEIVKEMLKDIPLKCLGHNKDGSPRHPLYIPQNQSLEDYK